MFQIPRRLGISWRFHRPQKIKRLEHQKSASLEVCRRSYTSKRTSTRNPLYSGSYRLLVNMRLSEEHVERARILLHHRGVRAKHAKQSDTLSHFKFSVN